MKVTVHSLGSVDAPASKVVLRDKAGKVLASGDGSCDQGSAGSLPEDGAVDVDGADGAQIGRAEA